MSDLVTFVGHVQEVLRDACREPHWTPEEAERYMADFGVRRDRFEDLAEHLNLRIVAPRLQSVASYFVNATVGEQRSDRSSCWFGFCRRFPAVTHVEFAMEHDLKFEELIVGTQTRMMPVLVQFTEQDNLRLPLDCVDEDQVADWVEERLLEFLDIYLRIDSESEDFAEEPVTDPVCGMRILRSMAAASDSFHGHPYFFCCKDCCAQFQHDPSQYIPVNTS